LIDSKVSRSDDDSYPKGAKAKKYFFFPETRDLKEAWLEDP
jgi:hypothetical protein